MRIAWTKYISLAWCAFVVPASFVAAQDFSALTELAQGALQGEQVDTAVPGFEIRVLQDGQAIYHQAFGDWSLDRPARTDSSTKTLSGALMMSLAETGESGFSLDSPVSDFLSDYDKPEYRDITIRQAFSHTSGLPSEGPASLILLNPNITLQQAARLISFKPVANGPPGSTFAYGGLSMHVAGAAAEIAAGENFVDLFAERITTPLGMTHTQFVAASQINPRVAGGVESTATDFARFMDMLLNEGVDRATDVRVLEAGSVEEMLTRQTSDAQSIEFSPTDNNRYGIGVWLDQFQQFDPAGPTAEALAGGARGFHSWIEDSYGLVFTFATDLTTFENVEFLTSLMHTAVLETVATPGDLNLDGVIDGADFLYWQLSDSASPADLAAWQADYPGVPATVSLTVSLTGSLTVPAAASGQVVPEPAASRLLLSGLLSCQLLLGVLRARGRSGVRNRA